MSRMRSATNNLNNNVNSLKKQQQSLSPTSFKLASFNAETAVNGKLFEPISDITQNGVEIGGKQNGLAVSSANNERYILSFCFWAI